MVDAPIEAAAKSATKRRRCLFRYNTCISITRALQPVGNDTSGLRSRIGTETDAIDLASIGGGLGNLRNSIGNDGATLTLGIGHRREGAGLDVEATQRGRQAGDAWRRAGRRRIP